MNPRDFVSWYRVLLLHEGIGPKRAQLIMDELASLDLRNIDLTNSITNSKFHSKIVGLLELIQNLNKSFKLPADKIEMILSYYNPLFKSKYDDFNKRKKDLDALINISSNYESAEIFLADMALEPPRDSVVDVSEEDKEDEHLTLTTIHSAKGLEWHSVFVMHAMEGFFPSAQAFSSMDSLEEERRLMYVAVTRAKQNLFLSYPMNIFDRVTGYTLAKPSRFITGVSEDLAEEWTIDEEF